MQGRTKARPFGAFRDWKRSRGEQPSREGLLGGMLRVFGGRKVGFNRPLQSEPMGRHRSSVFLGGGAIQLRATDMATMALSSKGSCNGRRVAPKTSRRVRNSARASVSPRAGAPHSREILSLLLKQEELHQRLLLPLWGPLPLHSHQATTLRALSLAAFHRGGRIIGGVPDARHFG
jgi:hypothetical protein